MNNKEELIHITLKQLKESFKASPENFRFEDTSGMSSYGNFPGPTIIWQLKVQIDEDIYIADPLNAVRTIIVTYNKISRQLQCYIFNREVNNLHHAMMADAQAIIRYNKYVPLLFYRTYRQFINIKDDLIVYRNEREFLNYIKKLNGIFPSTNEDDLFR